MIEIHQHADMSTCESVYNLSKVWRKRFEENPDARSLPTETFAEIAERELLGLGIGKRFGGAQATWPTICEVARIAGASCPSTGWVLLNCIGHALIAERMPESLAADVFANGPNQVIATASAVPDVNILADPEGMRLTGRFINSSAILHADWALVSFSSSTGVKGARKLYGLVPRNDIAVEDTWNSSGLLATGTNSFWLENYLVKSDKIADWKACIRREIPQEIRAETDEAGYLQHVQLIPFLVSSIMAPVLGCAEALADEQLKIIVSRCKKPISNGEISVEHHSLAESRMELESARALYNEVLTELHFKRTFSSGDIKSLRAKAAYVVQLCRSASARGHVQCGMPAIANQGLGQRLWRDFQVMSSHRDVRLSVALQELGEHVVSEGNH